MKPNAKPSRQYLLWLSQRLEQMLLDHGHTEEDILAYLTNELTNTKD